MKKESTVPEIEKLTKVGVVLEGHGLRGDVSIMIFSGDSSWTEDLGEIFLMPVGKTQSADLQIFEILKTKPYKKGILAQFKGVTDRNQSDALRKYEVWVPSDLFISENGEQPFLQEFLNFTINDKTLGDVGQVESFSSNGVQDLFILDKKVNGQNIEIPFITPFVIEVDYEAKKIRMDLPQGLIEINEKD